MRNCENRWSIVGEGDNNGTRPMSSHSFPDWPWNPMADLVLSCRDRASFCSSVWSSWTSAPFDLHLVAEVWNHGIFVSWMFSSRMVWLELTVRWSCPSLANLQPLSRLCPTHQDQHITQVIKNTIKAGGSTAFEQNVYWMDGYPLDCYDY